MMNRERCWRWIARRDWLSVFPSRVVLGIFVVGPFRWRTRRSSSPVMSPDDDMRVLYPVLKKLTRSCARDFWEFTFHFSSCLPLFLSFHTWYRTGISFNCFICIVFEKALSCTSSFLPYRLSTHCYESYTAVDHRKQREDQQEQQWRQQRSLSLVILGFSPFSRFFTCS